MATLPSDRPRRHTRNSVNYVEPKILESRSERVTLSTRGGRRGGRSGTQRGTKRPRSLDQEKLREQEENAKIEYDAPPAEKRRRRSLPLPRGTQVKWDDVSRQYLGQTFPTLATCIPEVADPTINRADVLVAIRSCIEKKFESIKTINKEILDAKAAIRFLEQQVVDSEKLIKQEEEYDLPVTPEAIEAAHVECAPSPSHYAMFAFEASPQKAIAMKNEPLDRPDDFSHASHPSTRELPENSPSARPMEEPTADKVGLHSEENVVNEKESNALNKPVPSFNSPIRSKLPAEQKEVRRFSPGVQMIPPSQFSACPLPSSWRNGQKSIREPSNYNFRQRDPSFGRYGYEEHYRQQYPARLYFHQQPHQRGGFVPPPNPYGPPGYYNNPHSLMDYNYNNRPVRRGRGRYRRYGNYEDTRRTRSPERPQRGRGRRGSWSRSPRR